MSINKTRYSINEYLNSIFSRYYDIKNEMQELKLYNVYSLVNVVIKMSTWAIKINDYELYEDGIYDYYCKMKKELDLVDEGELVKIMTNYEKACFYLLNLDKEYLRNFILSYIKRNS